jgi:hypothetical protein
VVAILGNKEDCGGFANLRARLAQKCDFVHFLKIINFGMHFLKNMNSLEIF